jgi:3-oxoacyl-[acyl-carrier-protein] synthase II
LIVAGRTSCLRNVIVGYTKSMTGHTLGAAGGLEAVICALVCRDGKIPPTINYETPDPDCDLNYGTEGMTERPVRLALGNSFGFGGHNVCPAIKRFEA